VPPNDRDLPDHVRDLLLGPVDSFEKLEVLLALHGAAGAAPLTLAALAARARLAEDTADAAADGLAGAGVVERPSRDTWRIAAAFVPSVDDLAVAWSNSRPLVLKMMTDRALGRIRTSAARVFADAFRLRKGGRDDGNDDG
jgi:hypothetical protein